MDVGLSFVHRLTCARMEEKFLLSKVVLAGASAVPRLTCARMEEEFRSAKVVLAVASAGLASFALLD